MVTYELQAEEVILYEGIVTCKLYKGRVKLILTSQKIVFEREKGIVKKNREIIDTIPLNSIKFYNGSKISRNYWLFEPKCRNNAEIIYTQRLQIASYFP